MGMVEPSTRLQLWSLILHFRCWTYTWLMVMGYMVEGVGEQLLRVREWF